MRKATFFMLIFLQVCLWTAFVFNQFGVGSAWAAKEEKKGDKVVEKSSTTKPVSDPIPSPTASYGARKSTTTKETELKRPKGISDLEWEKLKAKRPLPFDKGPSTIDISKYPAEMQDIYKNVFKKKCSKCHTIARPINAPYALPAEWKKYIKKMMKKPGSAINPIAAKKIYKFLVYDSSIRKKEAITKKLKEKEKTEKAKTESPKRKGRKK